MFIEHYILFLQSFDTNFSSLELLVFDISVVLLVYLLRLQMFFSSIAYVLLNIRETRKTFYLYTLYMVI